MNYERQSETIEVSVVIPCLNEEETLAQCIEKAARALEENQIEGEIIMADNGSTDSSRTIAENCGARVVLVNEPGYGNALMGGIAAARGRFVIIGDADASYDFVEIPKFVEKLRAGFDPSAFKPSSPVFSSAFSGCAGSNGKEQAEEKWLGSLKFRK